MNILFISQLYPMSDNAEESYALHYFVREWAKTNIVQVIKPYLPTEKEIPPDTQSIKLDSVKIDIVKPFWIPLLKIALIKKKKILDLITIKPDVIICHLYNSYLTFSFLKQHFNVPFIIGIHRSDVRLVKNILHRQRIKKIIKLSDLIVYRSPAVQNNFEKIISISQKSFIAYSGIPSYLIASITELLSKPKEFGRIIKIISVCKLIKLKQIDKVIIALHYLTKQGITNWEYTIIGDGNERNKLETLVQKLHLEKQIKFLGKIPREQVFEQMKKNDFFIMPSYNETFGLVYLEAMANGCIVIGSKGWGIDGLILDKYNGFLCNPYNQIEINEKLNLIFNEKHENLSHIRENSLKSIINFTDSQKAEDYLNEVKKLTHNI